MPRIIPVWVIRGACASATIGAWQLTFSRPSQPTRRRRRRGAPAVVQVQGRRRPGQRARLRRRRRADDRARARPRGRPARAARRRPHARRRARRMGSDHQPRRAARARSRHRAARAVRGAAARRAPRARRRAIVEQRRHRQRRHRVGDRRTAADRTAPRDRSGDPHDRADARRLRRRRVSRHRRRSASASRPSTTIRGTGVVIPAAIAWKTAATVLEHGSLKRGYLGLAGQPVALPENQPGADGREQALLVVGVTAASPAAAAGVLVGDVLLEFDGHAVDVARGAARSAARRSRRQGRARCKVLRGGAVTTTHRDGRRAARSR